MGDLVEDAVDLVLDADPLFASLLGVPGHDHRLRDVGEDGERALRARAVEIAERAGAADDLDELTRAVAVDQADSVVCRVDARLVEHTYSEALSAPVTGLLGMLPLLRPTGEEAERAYLTRLAAVPRFLAQVTERNRAGLAAGRLPLAHLVRAAAARVERYLADPAADPLRTPGLGASNARERDRLLEREVRPAFAAYHGFLLAEVVAHGRPDDRPGLCALPGGDVTYASLVRMHTTTDRTPEQLHRTGLDLIAGLEREYAELGFGTIAEVRERKRADPALRWRDPDEMLAVARATIARAEAVAPSWFGRVPSTRCAVERVPEADEPNAPRAYYLDPSMDGARPGTYFVNTHRASEQDRTLAEATAFHEAVPGHHFQLALLQETGDLPLLRRIASIEAHIEGWALYTERLADEMGLYSDATARLGMLALDSMRAARLVVDTGLHAFGWTRDQVVAYLRENTVLSDVDIQSETDRYVEQPGQALAYMVGRLEFQRLRAEASARQGDAFDLRAFHDLVLASGPLPMDALAGLVERRFA
ncbi:DUF885 domain-containing protein [Umezawaea tangerina]|uniref:Uncharacterized protein (DUF885 family) n=1 Tax=Umezawaea tangerina TaxID=84725 RepID=A0A2T0SRY2_9PSEU|nr:DUF885 domain-containing protein [Umezawaea tangerina]PRY36169.1 uncharacterized protein (DUF885 family) [Umezawaea tangerina]